MAGKKIVDEAKDAASAVTKKTKDAVTKTAKKGAKAAKDVAAKGATKTKAKTAIKATAKGKDAAKGALGAAAGIVGKVKDKAADVAGDVVDSAKDIAENAGETVGKVAKDAKETAENVVEGAKDLAQDAAQKVGEVAEDVGDAIKDGVEKIGGVGAAALGAGTAAVSAAASDMVEGGKKGGGFLIPLLLVIAAGGVGWYGWTQMGAQTTETAAISAEANMAQPAWFAGVVDGLKAKFPWLSLKLNGTSLIASGEAADRNAKDAALADLSMTIETSEGKGTLVIDDIKVAGSQETPVGAALAALGENPDAAACSTAFTNTMAGRTINFEIGAAKVNDDSASLLNVLTAIAMACKAHKIEVAGHTDARGNADANLSLSQARANAVKAFWVEKGVPADGLTAKGYGATKPLDAATSEEAYAKNRRTEFTVTD